MQIRQKTVVHYYDTLCGAGSSADSAAEIHWNSDHYINVKHCCRCNKKAGLPAFFIVIAVKIMHNLANIVIYDGNNII